MEAQKANVIPLPRDLAPASDEIDLRELAIALWQGKWWLFATTLIATCLAVAFALWSPNIYRAEALLTPSLEQQGGGLSALASRFGGLASLAGVNKGGDKASIAIEVGKVFDTEKYVINYENLGIGRLIYQLPTTVCEMFLREVFKQGSIESLDQETLFTIQRFFENNLNVSETSRGLFVHRNTLVYRLEKIKKLTGLDLREFDDAIVFKVALMVKKYLSNNPAKY